MESSNLHRFKEIVKILKDSDLIHGITPAKLYDTIEKLGPTFIKIGQIMSTRVDLLPEEYIKVLTKLRSNVTPLDYKEIEKILKKEYKNINNVFIHVNKKCIGSASIAQVHKARLKTGEEVVVKIKRPSIEESMKTDIHLLKKAVDFLHLNSIIKIIDLDLVIDEMYTSALEEIDFNIEKAYLEKFKINNKDVEYVDCPTVYKDLCTNNVIVMEFVDGIKIDDITSLQSLGYDLEDVANKLSENYIKQALDDGLFHADPHPDNIFIKDNKIVFLDLGMMGKLNDKNKMLLSKCTKAIIISDYQEVARILVGMSKKTGEVDYTKLRNDISDILEEFGDSNLENIETSKFITDMFKMLRNNNLVLDKDITMLIRGIGVIEAVLKTLNKNTSLLKVLTNREEKKNFDTIVNKENVKKGMKKVLKSSESMMRIPNELLSFIISLNNGETKFKFELSDSTNQVDKIETLIHELIIGFIDGCLILGASQINDPSVKFIFIIFIILLSTWLLLKMLIDHNHKGY